MNKLKCVILMSLLSLCGCGGSASENVTGKTVSGTVVFPVALTKNANKTVAASTAPALTIKDLSGNIIATPPLTVMAGDTTGFSFSAVLPADKDYVISAIWDTQMLKAVADVASLKASSPSFVVNAASTATVMVLEQKLNLPAGGLGTAGSATVQSGTLAGLSPTTLQAVVSTDSNYAALLSAVTGALTSGSDPATIPSVITLASKTAGWAYSATDHGMFVISQIMPLSTTNLLPLQSANLLDSITVTTAIQNVPLHTGTTQQLNAMGLYDVSSIDLTTLVVWSSSDISVATISTSGMATALATGITTITATLGDVVGTTMFIVTENLIPIPVTITPLQSMPL